MKLIAQVAQPTQPTPAPTKSWFDSIHSIPHSYIVNYLSWFNVQCNEKSKKDIIEEVNRTITRENLALDTKLSGEIKALDTKLSGEIKALDTKVENNTNQLSRVVLDIKDIKTDIGILKSNQEKIITAIKSTGKDRRGSSRDSQKNCGGSITLITQPLRNFVGFLYQQKNWDSFSKPLTKKRFCERVGLGQNFFISLDIARIWRLPSFVLGLKIRILK
ncbi:hypothetical protein HC766_02265 [Candidatus Gracilibacteria bacterium]|nr:hypothetical protein [Candidatus Gracilibacteria bacterium]